jgi:hypothetical protein
MIDMEKGVGLLDQSGHLLWQYPFDAIKATGDDGQRFFWIDFGPPGGEQVLIP